MSAMKLLQRIIRGSCPLAVAACFCVGCGESGLPTVPINGQITFGGGPPPNAGTVVFSPRSVAEGLPRRPGRGRFTQDGTFTVTSFKEGDGLIPGTYQPLVDCWKGQPSSDNPKTFETLNNVPSGFEAPEVVVEAGADSVEVKIDVPKKK
jgi:hypothetical protein